MRISDWSSDVCSSDLNLPGANLPGADLPGADLHRDAARWPCRGRHPGDGRLGGSSPQPRNGDPVMATADQSFKSLLSDLIGDVGQLIRQELRLAQAEASQKVSRARHGVTSIVVGAMLGFGALLILLQADRKSTRLNSSH